MRKKQTKQKKNKKKNKKKKQTNKQKSKFAFKSSFFHHQPAVMDSGEQEVDDTCISVFIFLYARSEFGVRRCVALSLSLLSHSYAGKRGKKKKSIIDYKRGGGDCFRERKKNGRTDGTNRRKERETKERVKSSIGELFVRADVRPSTSSDIFPLYTSINDSALDGIFFPFFSSSSSSSEFPLYYIPFNPAISNTPSKQHLIYYTFTRIHHPPKMESVIQF